MAQFSEPVISLFPNQSKMITIAMNLNDVLDITMYNPPLVPDDFEVPEILETKRFRLRPLMINDAVKDFEAVMESEERLHTLNQSDGDWPSGLTLEQNVIDLSWHQKEFQLRTSFAFTGGDLDDTSVLGCIYIDPTQKPGYDAEITMWVRQSQINKGLDENLFVTVTSWIEDSWPLKNPSYPGRSISFKKWQALLPQ